MRDALAGAGLAVLLLAAIVALMTGAWLLVIVAAVLGLLTWIGVSVSRLARRSTAER